MDGIELNLARLAEAGTTLSRVKTEFESASARSAGLATAVGHASLGRALDAFSDKWDDTREDMVANIGVLGEISAGIADAFTGLDTEYAAALAGEAG